MQITKLRLKDFRNFEGKLFELSERITVFIGPNASGKTNILESLYLLSTGKSFRARLEEEMVNYDSEISRVKGRVKSDGQITDLEAVLTRGLLDIGKSAPQKIARKKLFVNQVAKRLIDFASNFKVALFGPWDLDLVTESPSLRRNFLDTVLSQADREYRRAVLSYERGLRQRNRLLLKIREEGLSRSQLLFWDRLLIKNGDYLTHSREEFIDFINQAPPLGDQLFSVEYDRSAISEARLDQYADEEVAAATTLVGPHRDDFVVKLKTQNSILRQSSGLMLSKIEASKFKTKGVELAKYGSRGEQRMSVLWLKLAELSFIEIKTGERPTLLLDDIFSELDHKHREVVMKISNKQQTIITTADPHFVEHFKHLEIIKLK